MKQQHIPLHGTPNLRDLGGYNSRCSRSVAKNRIFRSGTLAYLNEKDWSTLENLNLGVICDFRREDEQIREPTKPPAALPIKIISLSVGAGSHTDYLQYVLGSESEDSESVRQMMRSINRDFVLKHSDIYSQFLKQILTLKNETSLLFHCAAGKDRTGFGAALFLSCLNVDRKTIHHDYLLTAEYFVPAVELVNIQQRATHVDWNKYKIKRLTPMLEVHPDYLDSAFAAIEEQWGNTQTYIREALKITDDEIAQLQNKFLVHND